MRSHRHLGGIWLFCFKQYFKAKYDYERNYMITVFTEVKTFVIGSCADFREFWNGFAFLSNKYFANLFLITVIENFLFVFVFNPKVTINFHKNALKQKRSVLPFFLIINGGDENVVIKILSCKYFLQVPKISANLLN